MNVAISSFKGYWQVPELELEDFKSKVFSISKNPEFDVYCFKDFREELARWDRVSPAEIGYGTQIHYMDTVEYRSRLTGFEIDLVIEIGN